MRRAFDLAIDMVARLFDTGGPGHPGILMVAPERWIWETPLLSWFVRLMPDIKGLIAFLFVAVAGWGQTANAATSLAPTETPLAHAETSTAHAGTSLDR